MKKTVRVSAWAQPAKPYPIDKTPPMPPGRQAISGRMESIRITLKAMKPGDSFVYADGPVSNLYLVAKKLGICITARKLNGSGCRVWRVK